MAAPQSSMALSPESPAELALPPASAWKSQFTWDDNSDEIASQASSGRAGTRNRAASLDGSRDIAADLLGSTELESSAYSGFLINSMPDELDRYVLGGGRPSHGPPLNHLGHGRPPGCAPDAIKLFVGNIPKSCTESQLLPFFETVGKVVDLVVVRDRATSESKGSAFVWYQTRAHAEQAILQLNMRFILPDPTGKQTRPLAIRKAQVNPRTGGRNSGAGTLPTSMVRGLNGVGVGGAGAGAGAGGVMGAGHQGRLSNNAPGLPDLSMLWSTVGGGDGYGAANGKHGVNRNSLGSSQGPHGMGGGMHGLGASLADGLGPNMHAPLNLGALSMQLPGDGGSGAGLSLNSLMQALSMSNGGHHGHTHQAGPGGAPAPSLHPDAFGPGPGPGPGPSSHGPSPGASVDWSRYPSTAMAAAAAAGRFVAAESAEPVSLAVPLTRPQVASVSDHMHSVRSMSGCQLSLTPAAAPGVFELTLRGSKGQINSARAMLRSVLGPA